MKTITEEAAKKIGTKIAQFNSTIFAEMNSQDDPEAALRIKEIQVYTESGNKVTLSAVTRNYDVLSFFEGYGKNRKRVWSTAVYPSPLETVKVSDKYGEIEVNFPVEYL